MGLGAVSFVHECAQMYNRHCVELCMESMSSKDAGAGAKLESAGVLQVLRERRASGGAADAANCAAVTSHDG
jgi:hypothetical protein